MKKLLCLFGVVGFASVSAQAGWLLEPVFGYATGTKLSYNYGAPATNYIYSESSIPVGGRIDYEFNGGFSVGLNGLYNYSGTLTSQVTAITNNENFTRGVAGAELGFRAGRVSFFAGYNPVLNFFMVSTTSNPLWQMTGSGYFGELSFRASQHFSVSVRYDYYSYTNFTSSATGKTSTAITANASAGAISGTPTDSSLAVLIGIPFGG